jgi:acetoacetyl-CoA synthetase
MREFQKAASQKAGRTLASYEDLHSWSVKEPSAFWELIWNYTGIIHSQPYVSVVDDPEKMPGARWFTGARLNFAQNLLRFRDDRTAIVSAGERGVRARMTYRQLFEHTMSMADHFRRLGVKPGDRIAGFVPNIAETIVCMLAATSLGAIWSSSSPDFGKDAVLDRFGQIEPVVMVTADAYEFKGRVNDCLARAEELARDISSIKHIVVIPFVSENPVVSLSRDHSLYSEIVSRPGQETFEQLPFDHQ